MRGLRKMEMVIRAYSATRLNREPGRLSDLIECRRQAGILGMDFDSRGQDLAAEESVAFGCGEGL